MDSTTGEKSRKILYLITKSNWGGAQRYVFDLAVAAKNHGFETAVAVGGDGPLITRLSEAGIRTIPIKALYRDINILNEFRVFFELIKLFRTERPDVIHLNSSKIGGLGGLAGRLTRVPHIIFAGHGWAFNEERSPLSKTIILLAHWTTVFLSHVTIAVSKRTAEQIKKLPFISKKVRVVYNGISPVTFKSRAEAQAELIRLSPKLEQASREFPNALWIGTASELHKNKGLDYMIAAMESIIRYSPNTFFIVMGEGEERKNLEALIEKSCSHNIFLLGNVPEARHYFKAFDIFTLTSRTEAFPYVILEAGLAALPTVASCVGGIPEVIEDMQSGILVKPYRPDDIAHSIQFLIEHPDKRREYSAALHETVKNKFSIERMIQATFALYYPRKKGVPQQSGAPLQSSRS